MVKAPPSCPVCTKEGQTSGTILVDCIIKTTLAVQHFYDDAGHFHTHDPNYSVTHFRCSRDGHLWAETTYASCSCGWSPERPPEGTAS